MSRPGKDYFSSAFSNIERELKTNAAKGRGILPSTLEEQIVHSESLVREDAEKKRKKEQEALEKLNAIKFVPPYRIHRK